MNVVEETRFSSLKKIHAFEMPYEFLSWLVDRFDHQNKCLNINNTILSVNETDVEQIFGFKRGNINVKKYFYIAFYY